MSFGPIPNISAFGISIPSADAAIIEAPVASPFKKEEESPRAAPTDPIIPFSSVEFNPKFPSPTEFMRCLLFCSDVIPLFCLLLPGVSMNFIKSPEDFPPKCEPSFPAVPPSTAIPNEAVSAPVMLLFDANPAI